MDEVITGDIPRPTKYFNSETKEFCKMAKIGMTQVINQLEPKYKYIFKLEKAKDGKEGKIVACRLGICSL